ncbi:MAG: hypothetical protein QME74_01180 [Candidatus Edwardsbacteria bacterium]|nr:hypothetical protein [Candidatus Edwardsbacteria bacterium]
MNEISTLTVIAAPVAAALVMHLLMIMRIQAIVPGLNGAIRDRQSLMRVKELINLSMKLAIFYIALYVLFILALVALVTNGMPLFRAVGCLFWFGVITLPMGLIGKHFEKKIRGMSVESPDPDLGNTFQRWLAQWREARYQLPE